MKATVARDAEPSVCASLEAQGIHPLLARIFAARGMTEWVDAGLDRLLPFDSLKNAASGAKILADAIMDRASMLIVADYDSDGATACAVGIRALRSLGAKVEYLVPNRFEYGYGLTPEIVRLAKSRNPELLITVDNGIASIDGVLEANRLGMKVLVTDHHLPGDSLPDALCVVNPNQPGCGFASKNLAGVGVIFYLMLALRAELRARGFFSDRAEPNFGRLLDLVALGTVADVVKLDSNNRILVKHGLKQIKEGRACAGIRALYGVSRRNAAKASAFDLGFALGPRLNAAGRLEDMALGIECLITDAETRAWEIAEQLDALNRERRSIEAEMQNGAISILEEIEPADNYSLALYDPSWHQGVIGILASRIKDKFHRPVFAFAKSNEIEIKGSGRSIPGLHLRDALDLVSKRHPDLILKFGGHAMAAGLTIREADFDRFRSDFETVARSLLTPADLERLFETDGELTAAEMNLQLASRIEAEVWGQGFPEPAFEGQFSVDNQRIVGEKHLKLKLGYDGGQYDAMLFFHPDWLPAKIHAIYALSVNEYNGNQSLQLILKHWEPA